MKVRLKIIVLLVSIIFLFLGCSSGEVSSKVDNFREEVEEYCKQEKIEYTSKWICEDFEIITFNDKNKYGIVGFFMDDEAKKIKNVENIRELDEFKNVDYLQIQDEGSNNVYLGVFIFDDEIVKRLEDVTIIFGDSKSNKPYKISVTCNGQNSIIIDYSSSEIREIEQIILTDKNGNDIYSQ